MLCIMLARALLMWWEAGVPFVCLLWPQNKSVVRGLLKGDLWCLWSYFFLISCFCSLCICYLVAIHFTFIWIVPVVYLLCLWPKNLCLFKSDGQSTGMVCTGAVSQIVKTCSSGQIHYRNMHHRFHWKVSFWCDDWWFLNLHKKISLSEATIALKHLFTCTRSCVK